jgi:hypothetical protein
MKHNYTNLEMLVIGIEEIAKNHGFKSNTEWEYYGEVSISGGCNIPTLADVKFLCECVHLNPSNIESSDFGIDVWIDEEFLVKHADYICDCNNMFWHRNQ